MSQITAGSVTFGRTVQPKEYESKKAEVTLAFSVPEGENHEAIFAKAEQQAVAKVEQMLTGRVASTKEAVAAKLNAADAAAPPAPKNGPGRPSNAAKAAAQAKLDAAAAAAKPNDDLAIFERRESALAEDGKAAEMAAEDDFLTSAAPAEVTDDAIVQALTRKNAALKNPVAIRQLIGKFVAAPKTAREIPQEARAEFLAQLEKL
jgi:hypothetical protein